MPVLTPYLGMFLFTLGIALLLRGFFGWPQWTHPACAKCRYDLRGLDPELHTQCPECGANLRGRSAVRFARTRRSGGTMALGALIAALPFLFVAGQRVQSAIAARLAQQEPSGRIVADLAANINDPQTWNELLNRHYDGRLSDDDVAAALDHLIAHLEAVGGAGNQPLPWSGQFLTVVTAEGRVREEQFERLCRAYYASRPSVQIPARVRSGHEITFDVEGLHWDLDGVTTIYALRAVTFQGEPVDVQPWGVPAFGGRRDRLSGSGPWGLKGNMTLEAEPGEHELVFEIDFGVIEGGRGGFSPNSPPGPAEQWPPTIVHEVREVRVPFTVLAPDESPITLVTDPRYRDEVVAGLRITALRLGIGHGSGSAELIFNPASNPPVPLSFKVYVRAGDFEQEIGSFRSRGGGMGRSGFTRSMPAFPDVESVDVVFRPDPKAVESRADWSDIWGEEIVIENVRVIRPAPRREMIRQAMRAALRVHGVDPGMQHNGRVSTPSIHMDATTTPVPARFQIVIRSGDYEHEIGSIEIGPHGATRRSGSPATGLSENVDTVTVIFRPNLDEREHLERMGYWEEEVIFDDVPVIRRAPGERRE